MTTLAVQGIQSFARGGVRALTSLALSTATGAITRALDDRVFEGPRLESFHLQTSRDGAPLPRVFGRARLAGQVIWASQVRETSSEQSVGGKGGGPTQRTYAYTISFAVALCEGEILGVDRIWANGEVLQRGDLEIRVHTGSEWQGPDPVVAATEETDVPAVRGTAYIVFEDFPLEDYGTRLPIINAEVVRGLRRGGRMETMIQAVNLLPATGEYALSTQIAEEVRRPGLTIATNVNSLSGQVDLLESLDQLQAELPNCRHVNLISAWFGTSMDAGACQVLPGAEQAVRNLPDLKWSVAGVTRESAYIVSQTEEGRANYGGTPADDSLVECIQELKRRGYRVTLYPFLLMDTTDFPWRGRITAASRADVASFFGTDGDFRFRHSILHHARMAQRAGGVDAIVIGSELVDLMAFREGEDFPAVEHMRELAGDVRGIVGQATKITYAADWSDYFGVQDGGDVRYHLDPLWADDNIDAVGIDAYLPLSDWRDGSNRDGALATRPHDLDYLKSNVEGGEGYDWYYASAEDRDSQIRTPIHDPVYRYKDMRHWWANPHVERRAGVPTQATPWIPRSKPLWLLEIGCPAVDKGANQPNVFYDPKSSESAFPYYSNGTRDDLIQRRYIEALLGYWEENNEPGFLDMSRAAVWAWDARPYPAFPAQTAVWSDGPNWERGHWLNGRTGLMPVADVIEEIAFDAGLDAIDVSGVSGVIPGYVVDRPMSARAALEPLLRLYRIEMSEDAGQVVFSLDGPVAADLTPDQLVRGPVQRTRADPERRIRDVRLTYLDAGRDYQLGSASARERDAESVAVADMAVPAVLDESFAKHVARRELDATHAGEETLAFSLPIASGLSLSVGDRVRLDGTLWAVETLETGAEVSVSARRDTGQIPAWVAGATPQTPSAPNHAGPPQLFAFDLPGRDGITVGALLEPFEPVRVEADGSDAVLDAPLRLGATLSALPEASTRVVDRANSLDIFVPGPAPSSLEDGAFLANGNRFAVETDAGWEVFAARDILLTAPRTYRLSHLLRGLDGSEAFMAAHVPEGARIVWLGSGLASLPLSPDWRGATVEVTGGSERRDARPAEVTWDDLNGIPPLPVHPRWDGVRLSWFGRDPAFTGWTEDSGHLRYRVRLFREVAFETVDTSTPSLETTPFDRAEIVQLGSDQRESLFPATLIVTPP
ncbi:MAG: glycoside hydrolase TIM-barrel-like domain-containing protein [Pseudomonadota bacterium]